MSVYNCRLYSNSRFNSVNIPDSPDLLEAKEVTKLDVDALDILQDRNLKTIRVKATWEQVRDVDYCRLTFSTTRIWFYSVENVVMLATDVAELSVIPDYLTSIGGVKSKTLDFLDGITERVHVANDGFGMYTSEDPLLTPCEPMKISVKWLNSEVSSSDNAVYIETTIDPVMTAKSMKSVTYSDDTGEYSVSVPDLRPNQRTTTYAVGDIASQYNAGTAVYPMQNNGNLVSCLSTARGLGVEQAIINQVCIPAKFVTPGITTLNVNVGTEQGGTISYNICGTMTGKDALLATGLNYNWTSNIKNNLINYSYLCKYGLVTAAGESAEFDPADIYEAGQTAPRMRFIVDPHTDGKPYYRYYRVNGDTNETSFWRNCCAGMRWKQVPLIWQGASGSILNTIKFQNAQSINANTNAQFYANQDIARTKNELDLGYGIVGNALGAVGSAFSLDFGAMATQAVGVAQSVSNYQMTNRQLATDAQYYQNNYNLSRKSELSNLYIANNVVTPTVNFPFNSDMIRDTYGNGVLAYRLYYSDNDVSRIDKLLTMYGYRHSKPLRPEDFNNRKNFNFVMCSNISVTGFAKWINEGIADQLRAGVRVWHTWPSPLSYEDNPVVQESA